MNKLLACLLFTLHIGSLQAEKLCGESIDGIATLSNNESYRVQGPFVLYQLERDRLDNSNNLAPIKADDLIWSKLKSNFREGDQIHYIAMRCKTPSRELHDAYVLVRNGQIIFWVKQN